MRYRIARRQRQPRLQPLEFDPGAGAGAQQPVGSVAQRGAMLLRILHERCSDGGKNGGDVAADTRAELPVDKRSGSLLLSAAFTAAVGVTECWDRPLASE